MQLPLVFNESNDPAVAGDVSMFDTKEQAEGYIEVPDVDDRYTGYDSEGRLLRLRVAHLPRPVGLREWFRQALRGGAISWVEIELAETEPHHAAQLRHVLQQVLASVGISGDWLSEASLSELVEAARPRLTIK